MIQAAFNTSLLHSNIYVLMQQVLMTVELKVNQITPKLNNMQHYFESLTN